MYELDPARGQKQSTCQIARLDTSPNAMRRFPAIVKAPRSVHGAPRWTIRLFPTFHPTFWPCPLPASGYLRIFDANFKISNGCVHMSWELLCVSLTRCQEVWWLFGLAQFIAVRKFWQKWKWRKTRTKSSGWNLGVPFDVPSTGHSRSYCGVLERSIWGEEDMDRACFFVFFRVWYFISDFGDIVWFSRCDLLDQIAPKRVQWI